MTLRNGPDFLVIGAAKSATTSLYRVIDQFDDVFMSDPKEPAFFSNPDRLKLGFDWYKGLFAGSPAGAVRGEASTTYSRLPYDTSPNTIDPWPRISAEFPEVKIIYMVRNPVDRAYSHYRHWMRARRYVDFQEAVGLQPPIIDCSRYRSQIAHVEKFMGSGRMFVETFERFSREPALVVSEVRNFLGLGHRDVPDPGRVENRHEPRRVVGDQLSRFPGASAVRRLVPKALRTRMVDKVASGAGRYLFRRQIEPEPLSEDVRGRLLETFEQDTRYIEEVLGRGLDTWRC